MRNEKPEDVAQEFISYLGQHTNSKPNTNFVDSFIQCSDLKYKDKFGFSVFYQLLVSDISINKQQWERVFMNSDITNVTKSGVTLFTLALGHKGNFPLKYIDLIIANIDYERDFSVCVNALIHDKFSKLTIEQWQSLILNDNLSNIIDDVFEDTPKNVPLFFLTSNFKPRVEILKFLINQAFKNNDCRQYTIEYCLKLNQLSIFDNIWLHLEDKISLLEYLQKYINYNEKISKLLERPAVQSFIEQNHLHKTIKSSTAASILKI